jgi:hypothetical protein
MYQIFITKDEREYIDNDLFNTYQFLRQRSLIDLNFKNDDSFRVFI